MILYKITNKIDGKSYIGQTIRSLDERWRQHCANSSTCGYISSALKKHGKENFTITEIGGANSQDELNYQEFMFIHKHNTLVPNGYNLRVGGQAGGRPSKELRKKMSKQVINIETGQIWDSVKECCDFHSYKVSTLKCKLNGNSGNNTPLRYLKQQDICKEWIGTGRGNNRYKKVIDIVTKQTWESGRACSDYFNIDYHNLKYRLNGALINRSNLRYVGQEDVCKKPKSKKMRIK